LEIIFENGEKQNTKENEFLKKKNENGDAEK
jgi:hypothetical protein